MYLVAVQCRTGHQESGWEYCIPRVRYRVEVDGKDTAMVRGVPKPVMRHKGSGWYDFSGWIVSRDFVPIKPGNRVKVFCEEAFTYILDVAFLTPAQAMQCGWLVPDVMGKNLESLARAREQLVGFSKTINRGRLAADGFESAWILDAFRPVIYDDFSGTALNKTAWRTYTNNETPPTFTQHNGELEIKATAADGYNDTQVYSTAAYNFFDRKTEFAFCESTSRAYAYTRNYITTSTGYPAPGFAVYFARYVDGPWKSRVQLHELDAKGQTAKILYDSDKVGGFGTISVSLVLEGPKWAFYWDTGTTGAATLRGSGTHAITREKLGAGLHLGFGLNNDAHKDAQTVAIHHAAVIQADPARATGFPDFSSVIGAMDEAVKKYQARLDDWKKEFAAAQTANDEPKINRLQQTAEQLRKETEQPLEWVREPALAWCRQVAQQSGKLPTVPDTGDYHARWSGILRGWIETYVKNLSGPGGKETNFQTPRCLGRVVRLLDLRKRYMKEFVAAKPQKVITKPPVEPINQPAKQPGLICLNGRWDFSPGTNPADPPARWESIRVPHGPWRETYGSFFNGGKTWNPDHHVGWYRTKFLVPPDWSPAGTSVRFEAVFHYTEVYVNEIYCGNHLGGFERFNVDISTAVRPGQVNEMTVMVKDTFDTKTDPSRNTREDYSPNYLPVNDLWGVNYGGIWQDVYLEYHPERTRIADVAVATPVRGGTRLHVKATIENKDQRSFKFRFTVLDEGKVIDQIETDKSGFEKPMPNVKLWGIGGRYGDPHLYRLHTQLLDAGRVIDERYDAFGFSQLWIEGSKFFLNGKPLFLAGGGIWYLQEDKFPLANRFYFSQLLKWDRLANVNIERIHRHGDMTDSYYAEAAEMGMLIEQETNPSAFNAAPEDMLGRADLEDPVWRVNTIQYYRDWSAKHRNWPCIGLTSIENETFSYGDDEELMQTGLVMADTVQASDPLRLYDFHGNHMMADHPGPKFVNLHYAEGRSLSSWKTKAKGRPIINGEHNMGGEPYANNHDRKVAAKGEITLADFWRTNIQDYLEQGAAGLFVFVPAFQAYCTTSDWKKTTPWGDLFKDLSKYNEGSDRWPCNFGALVPMTWPSLSGPDAKVEQMLVGMGRGTFNWFDPSRPVCTPTKVHQALAETFPKMTPCNIQRCQEALITVTSAGKPVPGATVILAPAENQPVLTLGAVTDAAGTAWIVPRVPGRYKVVCMISGNKPRETELVLNRYQIEKAGYEPVLVRRTVSMK